MYTCHPKSNIGVSMPTFVSDDDYRNCPLPCICSHEMYSAHVVFMEEAHDYDLAVIFLLIVF